MLNRKIDSILKNEIYGHFGFFGGTQYANMARKERANEENVMCYFEREYELPFICHIQNKYDFNDDAIDEIRDALDDVRGAFYDAVDSMKYVYDDETTVFYWSANGYAGKKGTHILKK